MKHYKLILFSALLLRIVFSFLTWHPDVNNHIDWGVRFWDYGANNFYSSNVWNSTWPNQPPGTIYIYAGVKKLYDFVFSIFWWINIKIPIFPSNIIFYLDDNLYPALLKLPSIMADFGIAYLIYKSISNKQLSRIGVLMWLINPVIWYNSSIWGQTDSVITFFVFLSFFLLQKDKPMLSILFFAISVYIKASLLIFIPIYAIIFLKKRYGFRIILGSFILPIIIIGILTLPFAKGNVYLWLFNLYKDKVFTQQLQVITANAFNIWASIATIHERPQSQMLGPLTYQVWGNILFVSSYLVVLWGNFKSKNSNIYWILSLIAFSSFMLLTNMHERYLYPFFPFFTVIAVQRTNLIKYYWIISFISLLNLYNFWWYPKIGFLISIMSFADRVMPRILGVVLFVSCLYLFKIFLRQTSSSKI